MCAGIGRACFAEGYGATCTQLEGQCTAACTVVRIPAVLEGEADRIQNDVVWEFRIHVFDVSTVCHQARVSSEKRPHFPLVLLEGAGHVLACPQCERFHVRILEDE